VVVDPQKTGTLFYSDGCALRKTTDEGGSWNLILPSTRVLSLTIEPGDSGAIYVVTDYGILKSTDGGSSWQSVNSVLVRVQSVAADPRNPGTIYAGALSDGVLKSTDGGESWTDASAGLRAIDVRSLFIDPRNRLILYARAISW